MTVGRKTGGRRKGTPNRATAAVAAAVAEAGLTPLAYLLTVMRDEAQPTEIRLDAARAAAPFVHPRLAAVSVSAQIDDQRDSEARRVLLDRLVGLVDQRPMRQIEGSCAVGERSVPQLR
jgi:hypothetical protein